MVQEEENAKYSQVSDHSVVHVSHPRFSSPRTAPLWLPHGNIPPDSLSACPGANSAKMSPYGTFRAGSLLPPPCSNGERNRIPKRVRLW